MMGHDALALTHTHTQGRTHMNAELDLEKKLAAQREAQLEALPNAEHVKKLHKTNASLTAYVQRGGTMRSRVGYKLLDRYEDHRTQLIKKDSGAWEAYCDSYGYDYRHDAYDFFA